MEIKKNIPSNTITRKLVDLDTPTGNIYESINIIARRANQIATELKAEINRKLADFSTPSDNSVESKQLDRYLAMLDHYYTFIGEYPESKHVKELGRMAKDARNYIDKNRKTEDNV